MYGSDVEFCDWMRHCKELPSFSPDFGFVATDTDILLHRYLTSVDGVGTRQIQCLMHVEVKTREGKPSDSQIDTLSKLHLFRGERMVNNSHIRYFGVFILCMTNTTPDNSAAMWWCVIPDGQILKDAARLDVRLIDKPELIELLRFDRHPMNFSKQPFRRHHKTTEIIENKRSPLGFDYEQKLIKRS